MLKDRLLQKNIVKMVVQESSIVSVFDMLVERLGVVEKNQMKFLQCMEEREEYQKKMCFTSGVQLNDSYIDLAMFFKHATTHVIIECPLLFWIQPRRLEYTFRYSSVYNQSDCIERQQLEDIFQDPTLDFETHHDENELAQFLTVYTEWGQDSGNCQDVYMFYKNFVDAMNVYTFQLQRIIELPLRGVYCTPM